MDDWLVGGLVLVVEATRGQSKHRNRARKSFVSWRSNRHPNNREPVRTNTSVPLENLLDHDQQTRDGEKASGESGWKPSPFPSRDSKRRHPGKRKCSNRPAREVDQRKQAGTNGGHHR